MGLTDRQQAVAVIAGAGLLAASVFVPNIDGETRTALAIAGVAVLGGKEALGTSSPVKAQTAP